MLDRLSVHHELWIKMLVNLGCSVPDAQDIVQDMYIRLHDLVKDTERIMYGKDVNKFYVYKVISNLYFTRLRKNKTFCVDTFDDSLAEDTLDYFMLSQDDNDNYDEQRDISELDLFARIVKHISNWNFYHRKLFSLYHGIWIDNGNYRFLNTNHSTRGIQRETGLNHNHVHKELVHCREDLLEEFGEDLLDYFNLDYDKV